jgi:hypothetical protein
VKSDDIADQTKAELVLLKVNDKLLKLDTLLPQVGIPKTRLQLQASSPVSAEPIFDEDVEGKDDQP